MRIKIYLLIVMIIFTSKVFAEGYAVNVQGVKQTGMGHVGTALNMDASSLQWNPGALATLDQKFSLSMGGFATFLKTEFNGPAGMEETDNPTGTPFYLYGTFKASDRLAFGLGVYTPFGNTVDWGKEWSGKYLVQNIDLKGIYIQPTVSYQLTDWMSVGGGFLIVYGEEDLDRAVPLSALNIPADGAVNIAGSNIQYGYNLGVFLQPTEKLNIGISYRSQVDVELEYEDADVDFTMPDAVAPLFPDGRVAASLPLPASLNLGVAYQVNDKWLLSADVNFVKWDAYKSLNFDFETNTSTQVPISPTQTVEVPVLTDSKSTRNWDNSKTYRFGAQYTASEKLALRAGIYYDETPTNDKFYTPETPGADKIGISAGFSYMLSDKLSVDATILYVEGKERTGFDTNNNLGTEDNPVYFGGKYKNKGFLPGIGITYNF
ncbi:hydrocarbon degradation protein [Puteibacter caeruleilacunae]|nr:hydrocarbon degradation protein [Puteibacter caeruleilacunae]